MIQEEVVLSFRGTLTAWEMDKQKLYKILKKVNVRP